LTPTRQDELDAWIKANDRNQQIFEELTDPDQLRVYLKDMENFEQEEVYRDIKTNIELPPNNLRRIFPFKKIAVAASIILVLGIGSYFVFFNKDKKDEIVKINVTQDVEAPKVTKASITLPNGQVIPIDSLTILNQSNVQLSKTSGQIDLPVLPK
jgi:hypothetical protein